ncbi:aminotransferase class I and II family protein [Bacillus anthracis]|nr:aminotransferase class I and II family protein [Bacillus anthracis]
MKQFELSRAAESLQPSGIRKFFDLAANMKGVISLGVGEPDFVTPWNVRQACIRSIEQGYTSYTANAGLLELRQEIAKYLKNNLQYLMIQTMKSLLQLERVRR